MDDRLLAFKILSKIEYDKAYSNLTLDSELKKNNAVSSAFVCALVYGVLERKITLDYFLSQFLTQPIKKLDPRVLTLLRLGVYQVKYMDKVPASAAVNESVKLSRKVKCSYASGLINSVLRKIASTDIPLPESSDEIYNLSIKYSCPEGLVLQFVNDYGYIKAEEILNASIGTVPTVIRVNTLKIDKNTLIEKLNEDNISASSVNDMEMLEIISGESSFSSNCYKKGYFHAQDTASQMCIEAFSPNPGETVFDMCSAPGGKSFTMGEIMNNKGCIYSFDLYEHKVNLIKSGAERLGIDIINAQLGDASVFNKELPSADKVLCDVPCAGLGVIRRKPEIKYKDFGFVDKLCELQYNILNTGSLYVKDGGILMYSTCSLSERENRDVCNRFLSEHDNFRCDGMTTIFPSERSDGFFFAKFIKE